MPDTMLETFTRGLAVLAVRCWCLCLLLLASNSALAATAGTAVPPTSPLVTKLSLVKKERVSENISRFTYRVTVKNPLKRTLTGVRGIASSRVTSSRLLDAKVSFPSIAPGKTALSTDTITIQQDTRKRLTASNLQWSVGAGLNGAPTSLATSGTAKLLAPPVDTTQIKNNVLLTRLIVVVTPAATVEQVDAALAKVNGTIVTMRPDSTFLTIAIPRPASLADLEQQRKKLEGSPGIAFALTATQPSTSVLPGEQAHAPAQNITDFSHLLATRFPAAWNAKGVIVDSAGECRRSLADRVKVLVPDMFPPTDKVSADYAGLGDELPAASFEVLQPLDPNVLDTHGYDVVGTLAASFGGSPITGANPFVSCLNVVGVPVIGRDFPALIDRLRDIMPKGHFIISSSLSWGNGCSDAPCSVAQVNAGEVIVPPIGIALSALYWKAISRDRNHDFLVVSAAGNDRGSDLARLYPGAARSDFSFFFNLATSTSPLFAAIGDSTLWRPADRSFPDLTTPAIQRRYLKDQAVKLKVDRTAGLNNSVVVGATTNAARLLDVERASFSEDGAVLETVGEGVFSFPESAGERGTSFAAPQVAGLASYLWLLSPELRARPVTDTIALIKSTSRNNGRVSHVIDAYAAVLGLDKFNLAERPIRRALLDVNDDEVFNQVDLTEYQTAYKLLDANRPSNPAADYSRYDLNGDGATGGIAVERFDLDANGVFSTVEATIEGQSASFDENALTDTQILCYLAYSSLYADSADARTARSQMLGVSKCIGLRIRASLPATMDPVVPQEMLVTVDRPIGNNQFEPVAGLPVRFSTLCADVDGTGPPDEDGDTPNASGPTDSAGQRLVIVKGSRTCQALTVIIEAGDAKATVNAALQGSCPPLVRFTKVAEANVTPGPSQEGLDRELSGSLQRVESGQATASSTLGRDGWSGGAAAVAGFESGSASLHMEGDFLLRVGGSAEVFAGDPVGVLPADPSLIGQRGTVIVRGNFAPTVSINADDTLDMQVTTIFGFGGGERRRIQSNRSPPVGDALGLHEGRFSFVIGENFAVGYNAQVRIFVSGFGHGSANVTLGAAKSVIVDVLGPNGQPMAHTLCTPQPAP
jgi:hypothetical protein